MWGVKRELEVGRFSFACQRAAALTLLVIALLLMAAAIMAFIRSRTTINPMRPSNASRLITSGVFRLTRNPIYLGDALALAAWAVWLGNFWAFWLVALFVAYIDRAQIAQEEAALRQTFGQAYTDYCARVRRWL